MIRGHLFCGLGLLGLLLSCAGDDARAPAPRVQGGTSENTCAAEALALDTDDEPAPEVDCTNQLEGIQCHGAWAAYCDGRDGMRSLQNCRQQDEVCVPGPCEGESCTGCVTCQPRSTRCGQDGARYECTTDGSEFALIETCDEAAGERCSLATGACENLCEAAVRERSYIGCEYFAVATANSQLEFEAVDAAGLCQPFPFAVVIANTQGVSANVRIDSPGQSPRELSVDPFDSITVNLPCDLGLKGNEEASLRSVFSANSAHHIVSDVPVTVYQFNPLEFESELSSGEKIYSHTNDASLLLPVHALTGNYRVMARPTLLQRYVSNVDGATPDPPFVSSGFVAITGVEDTPTEVVIRSSAHTRASADGRIPKLAPGQAFRIKLAKGDVLQLVSDTPRRCGRGTTDSVFLGTLEYCKVPTAYDLTGTEITSDGRVSVIAGHDCAFVPYNRWACDHLEETMFPVETWGKSFFMTISATTDCRENAPNLFRVLSDSDDNRITFVPPVIEPVTLQRGDYVEFASARSFSVRATDAITVAQFLVGQDYEGRGESGSFFNGDPSMSLGIPVEQWRSRYSFLTPSTYTDNFINVVARKDSNLLLDGKLVTNLDPIEGTEMFLGRVRVGEGPHIIEASELFGFVAYGFAPYTSYMVPGGLDLYDINKPD